MNPFLENIEWWDLAQKNRIVLSKLRWATLGYHHNWDTKVQQYNIYFIKFW